MKYCKDCCFFYDGLATGLLEPPGCRRFSSTEKRESPVYGITYFPHWKSCREMREEGAECGPEAKEFQPRPLPETVRPTFLERLANWWE